MNKIRISAAILPDLWAEFRKVCELNDESASRRLQILIKNYIREVRSNAENE